MDVPLILLVLAVIYASAWMILKAVRLTPRDAPARRPGEMPAGALAPAIGISGDLSRRERILRLVLLLAAVVVLIAAFATRLSSFVPLSERELPLPAGAWVVPDALLIGGQPDDTALLELRDLFNVSAVVNLRTGGRVEGNVVREFRLAYQWLPLDRERAPSTEELASLVRFVIDHTDDDRVVFLHDDTGRDRAPLVATMLLMLRGDTPVEAVAKMRAAGAVVNFTPRQVAAINELSRALGGPALGRVPAAVTAQAPRYDRSKLIVW